MRHAVIMAGGSGTRFWPLSRRALPKQLLKLSGERTLIQAAFDRSLPAIDPSRVWVVTNAVQADETRRQLPDVPKAQVLVEPCGRNTAPCIGLAAIQLLRQDPEAVMIVMPADHLITPASAFCEAIDRACSLIAEDPERLVLFGVKPTHPSVGYGYIERSDPWPGVAGAYRVASFREKPAQDVAEQYLASGRFYWNCGIFVWRAETILAALERHEPEIHARLLTLSKHIGTQGWQTALEKEFPAMKSISIDYAVLEHSANICVHEAPFEWDDIGAWQALERVEGTDEQGNTVAGLHVGIDTTHCIIRTTADHLVATIGLTGFVVVHTPDATLIAPKDDEAALRTLVETLQAGGHDKFL